MRVAIGLDPDPLRLTAAVAARPGTVLLHTGDRRGRSVLLFDPRWTATRSASGRVEWSGRPPTGLPVDGDPLTWPTRWTGLLPRSSRADDVPWLAGFLGHEVATARLCARHPVAPPFRLPDVWLAAYDTAVVFDPDRAPRLVVRDLGPLAGRKSSAEQRAEVAREALSSSPARLGREGAGRVEFLDPVWHRTAVTSVHEHLRRGDCYQINLTGFARAETELDPFEGFRREATSNPTPFAAFLRTDAAVITSHSPELLLRRRGSRVQTRPIKGTAPAGGAATLAASAKDRAEHVMIVDLCRNDLGRCARPGTVRVDPLMVPLAVRGITHLVSTVHALVSPASAHRLLPSLAPGGSITGAPKRRACEILREVETSGRGPYTGTIGAIAPNGDMDWNIAIRTAVWQDGAVHFGCGGGIVLDSEAESEFEEARLKARSFFASLGTNV